MGRPFAFFLQRFQDGVRKRRDSPAPNPYNKGMEKIDHDQYYKALLSRDRRFDGHFFVGVTSTGIYCRNVCPVKPPKRENCTFHPSAAAAERAGFRPCLRCRPELAPGNAHVDAVSRLASAAAGRIEDGALTRGNVANLAAELGVTDRHLRRVLASELGATPIQIAQTQRLLLAKRLLTDTQLTVTEVAFASGFESLRRFNALFQERYRMRPTDLRRARDTGPQETLTCDLAYRPPLEWGALLGFLAARATCGVEVVENGRYLRTVQIGKHAGWIAAGLAPNNHAIRIEVSSSLASALMPLLGRVKRLFDLAADPCRIASDLGKLAERRPGLRVPGAFDGFSLAVRAILGQQVSVRAASTLAGRLAARFGQPIETSHPGLTRLDPTAESVAAASLADITALGVTTARAQSILALARSVHQDGLTLEPGGEIDQTLARLKALPGIGEWTAQYIAMRALGWPDSFPHTDLGIIKALGETNPRRILEIAESWRPWRSYAAMHLWTSLEEGK